MAKRYTATEKWGDPWFRKLPNEYKCLWDYICCQCDIAGIWKVDFDLVNFCLGNASITDDKALELFNSDKERIRVLHGGAYWLIVDFVHFQYGVLGETNRVHIAVRSRLESFGIDINHRKDTDQEVQPELVHVPSQRKLASHQKFVEKFSAIYTKMTGQPFKADRKHFVIVAKLIEKYGMAEVEKKVIILANYCKNGDVWFTKGGFADFTIEKLSSQWNSLIPQVRKSDQEIKDEKTLEGLRELRDRDERINEQA